MPRYRPIQTQTIDEIRSLSPDLQILEGDMQQYGRDETENLFFKPELVVSAHTEKAIALLLKYCHTNNIPVTTRGAGTGLSGGALPTAGGIVLLTEKLNRIIKIDFDNFQAIVQPGVINEILQQEAAKYGLFFGPDPASKGSSFIGGNIAENAGGPKALKYGTVKDNVLNLKVVCANGEIIQTGANTLKNSTGYNLTQLIIGSEGTLGIVIEATLKLYPLPAHTATVLIPFHSEIEACKAVNTILLSGLQPVALEFMEKDALLWSMDYSDEETTIPLDCEAHLLVQLENNLEDRLFADSEKLYNLMSKFDTGEILFAGSKSEEERLWKLRRNIAHAVHDHSIYKEEDTVVPRAYLPQLLKAVKEIGDNYGFKSVCYGHAGDGNLHVNIVRGNLNDEAWNITIKKGIREIFQVVKKLGGTISGEHGIGWVQKEYMDIAFSQSELNIMKQIKSVFDPNGILNPGKIFPDA